MLLQDSDDNTPYLRILWRTVQELDGAVDPCVKRASSGLIIAALESMKKTLILCASPALISIEIVGCKQ